MNEGYEDEANDHQEKPRYNLFQSNHMPYLCLTRIDPDMHIGRNIFCDPDDTRHQDESYDQIHGIVLLLWFEVYFCFSKCDQYPDEEEISQIHDKMMCKKVEIYPYNEIECDACIWIILIPEIKYPPYSGNIASHCRIHKSSKERNSRDSEGKILRILP
jgi:hypothetical protein